MLLTIPVQTIDFLWVLTFTLLIIILFMSLRRLIKFLEPDLKKRIMMYFLLTIFTTTEIIFGINLIGLFPIPSSDMTQASDYNTNPYCSYNINPSFLVWLNRVAFQSFNAMIISLNLMTIYLVEEY